MTKPPKIIKEPKSKDYKIPCDGLNKIITVKKLSESSLKQISKKLKRIVKDSTPKNGDVLNYLRVLILTTLTVEERDHLAKILKSFSSGTPEDKAITSNILFSIYHAIISIYPILSIQSICDDVNGIMPENFPNAMQDQEFEQHLKKETQKKTKKKKFEFSSLKDIEDLKKHLQTNLIGQDEAVESVCNTVKLKVAGFSKVVNLFFIGKSGRGKSELARLLGQRFSDNFWLINCAEFSNGHEVNRILGAPPGYIGHSDKSILKEKSEKSNKWVIVFDEIEKANPKFYNFLLALMETGVCYDNIGTRVDFSDSIFIFTSNCGLKDLKAKSTNFHFSKSKDGDREELEEALKREFSPEFRNRIDEFIFFNDLTKEDARKIVTLRLKDYPVKKTPEIVEYVVNNGFSEEFGARELTRFIKKNIALPLADTILDSKVPCDGKDEYEAIVDDGKVKIVNTVLEN